MPLSVKVKVIVAEPLLLAADVITAWQLGADPEITTLALGITVVLDETALTLPLHVTVESMSAIVNVIADEATSSSEDLLVIADIVGASLTGFTVNRNAEVAVLAGIGVPLSVSVRVIVAVPDRFAAGVMVAIQFGAVPVMTIFPLGTKVVLLEVPATLEQKIVESVSEIVKAIPAVAVSSLVDFAAMAEITGAMFAWFTVNVKVFVVVSAGNGRPLSVKTTVIVVVPH